MMMMKLPILACAEKLV